MGELVPGGGLPGPSQRPDSPGFDQSGQPGTLPAPLVWQPPSSVLPPPQAAVFAPGPAMAAATADDRPLWERRRRLLIAVGILMEIAAVIPVISVVYMETRREETALGVVGKYAWRLGWHDTLHSRWMPLLVACVAAYVLGSTLVAWVLSGGSPWCLALAPVVAVASVAALGIVALVLCLIVAAAAALGDGADLGGCWFPDGGGNARRRRRTEQSQ